MRELVKLHRVRQAPGLPLFRLIKVFAYKNSCQEFMNVISNLTYIRCDSNDIVTTRYDVESA